MRRFAFAILLLFAAAGSVRAQTVLNRGNGAEPDTLDPAQAGMVMEINILGDLMEGLVTRDAAARPIPGIAERWETEGLYQQIRKSREGREKFIFHDGPPYANGDIHIGHALNHTLKDVVVRTQTLLGKDAPYVPGWDCHGLPIEWKVEEQYRKKKLDKDQVPVEEFRAECRAYAQHWVDVQREQLKRLGIGGDWDNPYLTMHFEAEATIVPSASKFMVR